MATTKTMTMTATSYSTWLLGPARATTEIRYRWLSKPPETTIFWFHVGPIDSKPWERSVLFDVINTITNTIYHCLRTHLPGQNRYSTFGNSPHPNDFKTISIATDIPMTWFLIITTNSCTWLVHPKTAYEIDISNKKEKHRPRNWSRCAFDLEKPESSMKPTSEN